MGTGVGCAEAAGACMDPDSIAMIAWGAPEDSVNSSLESAGSSAALPHATRAAVRKTRMARRIRVRMGRSNLFGGCWSASLA